MKYDLKDILQLEASFEYYQDGLFHFIIEPDERTMILVKAVNPTLLAFVEFVDEIVDNSEAVRIEIYEGDEEGDMELIKTYDVQSALKPRIECLN